MWRVEVRGPDASGDNALVLIDATDGSTALVVSGRKEAKNRNICDLGNARVSFNNGDYGCTTVLNPVRREGGAASSVVDVNKAYDYSGSTYDYYKTVFNRDSINNQGMPLNLTVRACAIELGAEYCPYANAFWDGAQMVYGQGFASADDVVAHELTHGVTDYTSELYYAYQSGAINESLSDIFGEFVDIYNGLGNDAAGSRWQLGEDLPSWVGVIRNMANPPAYQQPDRMTSPLYLNDPQDSGGVHTNSGVGNKAGYLITDGGSFNGQTITGLGLVKSAQIWYRVMYLLSSGSDYADLAGALTAACHSAVGVRGITEADCDQVAKVITAVEMTAQPTDPASQAPDAPLCDNAGQPTTDAFADDMENTQSGTWTFTGGWHYLTKEVDGFHFAHSGKYALNYFVDNQAAAGTAAMANPVTVPSGTSYLWFAHVEFGTDAGSAVKPVYRENGGAWVDATPLIDSGARPDGAGSFTGDSHGWVSTRLDVSSLAGKTVQFGFDVTTGAAARYVDWYVDDVKLYQCAAKPGAVRNLVAQGRFGTANLSWEAPQYAGAGVDHYTVSATPAVDGLPKDVPADQLATDVTGLDQATGYTFTVTAVQADGTAGPATTASFQPVGVTIAVSPSIVDYGASVTVTGTAVSQTSGGPLQYGTVWLYGRRTGTTAWNWLAQAEVNAQGGFTFSHKTPAPY